jgi:hypothetical protein
MNFWLVKACVERSEYMASSHEFDDLRLVRAESAQEAQSKYHRYWEMKSFSYGTSYYVLTCEVVETVE